MAESDKSEFFEELPAPLRAELALYLLGNVLKHSEVMASKAHEFCAAPLSAICGRRLAGRLECLIK